jgi:hypothetical protein
MADSKITALTAISTVDPTADPLVIVDVSDTSMAASGTTKKSTINQLLGSGGTATLASATITGAATVGTTLGVTGVSTFAAGTALLPALTTTGDTNTGIYYPAADTFAVTTGGTERYRVDSSGNVGIGVTPSYKLDVSTGGALNTTARLVGNDQTNVRLRFENTGAGGRIWELVGGFAGSNNRWFSLRDVTGSTTPWGVDDSMNVISNVTGTAPTLATNSQMVFNLTSNTNLRISVRGTDGTTRTANITLA